MINQIKTTKLFIAISSGVILFLVIYSQVALGAEPKYSEKWIECRENSECVVIEGTCAWTCVNETFASEAQKFYKHSQAIADCSINGLSEPKPRTLCTNHQCECVIDNKSTLGKQSLINLARLSMARVSASSVNGGRSLSDQFYGVRNLFDEGAHWINNPHPINYTYWLTDAHPKHWVEVRFSIPVEVHQIVVEIPGVWETETATKNIVDQESEQPRHIASTTINTLAISRSTRVPAEYAIELEYMDERSVNPVLFDSVPVKGFLSQYSFDQPQYGIRAVKIIFPGGDMIEVHEIKIMGRPLMETDLTPVTPLVEMDLAEAQRLGREVTRDYIGEKYSVDNIDKRDQHWVYTIRNDDREIISVTIDELGAVKLIDLESKIEKDFRGVK